MPMGTSWASGSWVDGSWADGTWADLAPICTPAPIGTVWAAGSWSDTAWCQDTWADSDVHPTPSAVIPIDVSAPTSIVVPLRPKRSRTKREEEEFIIL